MLNGSLNGVNGTLQPDMAGTMTAGHALRIADRRLGPISDLWYFVVITGSVRSKKKRLASQRRRKEEEMKCATAKWQWLGSRIRLRSAKHSEHRTSQAQSTSPPKPCFNSSQPNTQLSTGIVGLNEASTDPNSFATSALIHQFADS
jgi:hypothetical protein